MSSATRTEVQVAGEVVVRLIDAALIPGTPEALARSCRALGISVNDVRAAHLHLTHHTYEPPFALPCPLRQLERDTPRKRRQAKVRPTGPHSCDVDDCDRSYPTRQGLASHRLAAHAEKVPCPECSELVNPRGIGAHRYMQHGHRRGGV